MNPPNIYPDLVGKKALVYGGSKGIGLAVARSLLASGADVLILSRSRVNLEQASQFLSENPGTVHIADVDLSKPDFLGETCRVVDLYLNHVDILVNNSSGPPLARLEDTTDQMWNQSIHNHLYAPVQLVKTFIPSMAKAGYGRIITISSSLALEPSPEMILSSTVRAGISTFSKAIATDYAHKNVTINVICPGGVLTERLADLVSVQASDSGTTYDSMLATVQESIPAQRFAQPSEIGYLTTYLCSPLAGYITGQSIVIDGGVTRGF